MSDDQEPKPTPASFPTEFPADAARAIGNAILTRSFTSALIEPLYDLIGYGLAQVFRANAPFPKPVVSYNPYAGVAAETGLAVNEAAVGSILANAADETHNVGAVAGRNVDKLPWGAILKVLLKLAAGLLLAEKPPTAEADPATS